MKHFAVFGNPIIHSKSPDIFRAAYSNHPQYTYIRAHTLSAARIPQMYDELKLDGINITAPFKSDIITQTEGFLADIDPVAKQIGAINTVVKTSDGNKGYNTDFSALQRLFRENINLQVPQTAVVIGAGGAALAVIHALKVLNIPVVVVNRTHQKAINLSRILSNVEAGLWDNLSDIIQQRATIVVNTLPCGIDLEVLNRLTKPIFYVEAGYAHQSEQYNNCKTITGKDWLIAQGEDAYMLFTRMQPDIEAMNKAFDCVIDRKKPLAIIGFMGSGKSSVVDVLKYSYAFATIDSDKAIEEQTRQSVTDYFKENGETAFRNLEYGILDKYKNHSNLILSCGGGIVTHLPSLQLLQQYYRTVWIYTPVSVCWDRIKEQRHRPLVQSSQQFFDLYQHRIASYHQATNWLLDTHLLTPEETAEIIRNNHL